jgi:hypothetical protein
MRKKNRILYIVAVLMLFMDSSGFSENSKINRQFDNKFNEAQEILLKLLFPNTMARSEDQTIQNEEKLLYDFQIITDYFITYKDLSIPFLADKLASTPAESLEPGVCALQLLFEINTKKSIMVIQDAIKSSNEVISKLARQMIDNKQDALWGFGVKKK